MSVVSKYGPCLLVGIPLAFVADRVLALVIAVVYAMSFSWTRADAFREGWDEATAHAHPTYPDAPRSAP